MGHETFYLNNNINKIYKQNELIINEELIFTKLLVPPTISHFAEIK